MAPYGYKNIRDENKKPLIIPDDKAKPVVQYIFNEFLQGTPIVEIGREAKKIGFLN